MTDLMKYVIGEYPGAMKNGTRVVKVFAEPGDAHPLGALATGIGSMGHPSGGVGYFVIWDGEPGVPVFVMAKKLAQLVD